MRVSIYGAGQVGTSVARLLSSRDGIEVLGPFSRRARAHALGQGTDVVVIATTSFLKDVAADIRTAVDAGSNVLTTAEEAAYPWAVDKRLAAELDQLARNRGVSIIGRGLNPGFTFDALVATACGPLPSVKSIHVERVVDLSGFGRTVLQRIGVGYPIDEFHRGANEGRITGHIGFPQSMSLMAAKLGLTIDRVEKTIEPILATADYPAMAIAIAKGNTAGFKQHYRAVVNGATWFTCLFTGHVDLKSVGLEPRDELQITGDPSSVHLTISPGLNPQRATPALIVNTLRPLIDAAPGWITVADLPPATP